MMRYFTMDWYHISPPDEEEALIFSQIWSRYRLHLEEMEGVLPADVLALARLPGVDDALVVFVRHDRARRVLTLTLRAGDRQMRYYDLVLRYEGAEISPSHERTLAWIARTTISKRRHVSDVYSHELDTTADGQIEHRLLFFPGLWFSVRCETLHWVRLPRPDRKLPKHSDRFPDSPVITRHHRIQT